MKGREKQKKQPRSVATAEAEQADLTAVRSSDDRERRELGAWDSSGGEVGAREENSSVTVSSSDRHKSSSGKDADPTAAGRQSEATRQGHESVEHRRHSRLSGGKTKSNKYRTACHQPNSKYTHSKRLQLYA